MAKKIKDITGQKFGKLTALYYDAEMKKWHCKCDCGNECNVPSQYLISGNTKSCGCLINHCKDLTGRKVGNLTVLYPLEETEPKRPPSLRKWHCKCDCGNECDVAYKNLISESIKSCGCMRKGGKYKDITGQKFGKLTALYLLEDTESKKPPSLRKWHCKCDCGNECDVAYFNLTSEHIKSCGCMRKGRKYKDITGQKFGKLTALYLLEDTESKRPPSLRKWHCKCDCGNECDVRSYDLIDGSTKSCGCMGKCGKYKDITGQKFGKLTALYYDAEMKKWHCKCDCGNECDAPSQYLISGRKKSCGCIRKVMKYEDIIGQKFGKLTVLYPSEETEPKKPSLRKWHCKCDCGNECDVAYYSLHKGTTRSCGCLHYIDITGEKFGKLTALYPVKSTKRTNSKLWHCKCDCGNECDVTYSRLVEGNTKSCGCLKKSKKTDKTN